MGETIYGPLPEENRPRRFMPIIWMVLGACLALGAERAVVLIPKGETHVEAKEEVNIKWVSEDGVDVEVVTWPAYSDPLDISWKSETKDNGNTDTIIVAWPWKSTHSVAFTLDPDKAKQLLELYERTSNLDGRVPHVDGIVPTQQ